MFGCGRHVKVGAVELAAWNQRQVALNVVFEIPEEDDREAWALPVCRSFQTIPVAFWIHYADALLMRQQPLNDMPQRGGLSRAGLPEHNQMLVENFCWKN